MCSLILNVQQGNYHKPGDNFDVYSEVKYFCEHEEIDIVFNSELRQFLFSFEGNTQYYLISENTFLIVDDAEQSGKALMLRKDGSYTLLTDFQVEKENPNTVLRSRGDSYALGGVISIQSVNQITRV